MILVFSICSFVPLFAHISVHLQLRHYFCSSSIAMDAEGQDYDDGEVSIRGRDVFYNASPQANVDNNPDDMSDQISIHSSHDDYNGPSQSLSVDEGSEHSDGRSVRHFESPSRMESPWHMRSEAASAPPDAGRLASNPASDHYDTRRDRSNMTGQRSLSGSTSGLLQRNADNDYRAARSNAIADRRDSTAARYDSVAGGTLGSRQINEAATAYDSARQGNSASEQHGATTRSYSNADGSRRTADAGDQTDQRQAHARDRPIAAARDRSTRDIGAGRPLDAITQSYTRSATGGDTTRYERSDERNWSNADRHTMTTNSRLDSNPFSVSNSHSVLNDFNPNTDYSQSNVVMMPVYYDRPNDIASSQVRPMGDINTGLAGLDPRLAVDIAMQRGVVPHRLDDGPTRPEGVEIEQVSRGRGVDFSARPPVGYRDFNFSSGCPDGRDPHQTESQSQHPVVPDTTRPGVVMTGIYQPVEQRRDRHDNNVTGDFTG